MATTEHQSKLLPLTLFKAKEGLSNKAGVTIYEGVITFAELAEHFPVEANSDVLNEQFKRQRDVDAGRVNALKRYWSETDAAVFPNMTFFCNELSILQEMTIGNRPIITALLPSTADRFIADGQGRTTFIKWLLAHNKSDFNDFTVSFKLIHIDDISLSTPFASKLIRQLFSDYHVSLKKPNQSISNHFNNRTPFASLLNELLELNIGNGKILKDRIGLHGKINRGTMWKFDQLKSMILKFIGVTASTADKYLIDQEQYELSLNLCQEFLREAISQIPTDMLDGQDFKTQHDAAMFTKVVFTNGLGLLGRSIFDSIVSGSTVSFEALKNVNLPIDNKGDKFWLKNNVTTADHKIVRGSDKRIGSLMCQHLKVFPTLELMA
ncbi:DGQHR domain-containing protein [Shewanella xiamenensis]|uniref:DGQHR domain-containing protein n=1 Tax=Shewanella xiamenensis TaxID=332186 RepID=UPI002E7B83E1|nr:DGQHR domain-containing protein [Shewanella xiamenensis]MEE1978953.1 DGQHR domain-containing protein [Shewanella xiamenensis]